MAITELKGKPVLLTPSLRGLVVAMASQTRAKMNTFEMLWIVKGTSASPMAKERPCTPAMQTPNASGLAFARAGM